MVVMPYRCLADFLEELGHTGELIRVDDELEPALEVAETAARAAKSGGPAMLFGAVKGHDLPVLCNLLGTEGRICRALGVASLDEVADRIARLFDMTASEGWFERLKGGAQPAALGSFTPRKVKSAACQQIVRLGSDVDLGELPLLQMSFDVEEMGTGASLPADLPNSAHPGSEPVPILSSPAITGATVLSAEPDSHRPVAGRFDLQRLDRTRLAVCWAAHDEHARLLGEYGAKPNDAAGSGPWRRSGVSAGGRRRRCRPVATSAPWRACCAKNRSTWPLAAASIWTYRPRRRSCWKVLSTLRSRRSWPGRSAVPWATRRVRGRSPSCRSPR